MTKLKPALLGGLIAGILAVIPFINTCCCIWAILGGFLAAMIYVRGSAVPVSVGEGAIVGGLTGVVGSVIYAIIQIPVMLIFGLGQMEEAFTRSGVELPFTGIVLGLAMVLVVIIGLIVFSVIGGLIGVAVFEKRKGNLAAPPPPPPGM